MLQPQLTRSRLRSIGERPRGVVLMLHGGAETNLDPVGDRSLPWLRSRLMMLQLGRAFHSAGLEVWLLRYRLVGWNLGHAELPSPVEDARWALDEVRRAHGDLPVVLLGHSMGARTAATVADDRSVRGVVALAPWFPPAEPVEPLAGRRLLAAHGRADEVTSFDATRDFVRRARSVADGVDFIDMGDLDHAMVRGLRSWNRVARDGVLAMC